MTTTKSKKVKSKTPKPPKMPVTARALMRRINRKLEPSCEMLHVWRSQSVSGSSVAFKGDYYRIDFNRNLLVEHTVDIEALGRELGVLKPWECLAKEGGAE